MTAYTKQLADAVVALITAGSGDLSIEAAVVAKRYLPIYDLADLKTPKIAVAPRFESRALASRSKTNRELIVQVAPHVAADTVAGGQYDEVSVDAFVDLMDEVANLIETAAKQSPIASLTLSRIETAPLYDDATLQEKGVLRGVLTLTFRAAFSPPAA